MVLVSLASLLVAVLVESSLVAWPVVLWSLWWWSSRIDWSWLVWVAVIAGVFLDVLVVKTIGVSALALWGFVVGLLVIRQWFSGMSVGETGWVVLSSIVWGYVFGGYRQGKELLIIGLLAVVVVVFGRRVGSGREIRLRG